MTNSQVSIRVLGWDSSACWLRIGSHSHKMPSVHHPGVGLLSMLCMHQAGEVQLCRGHSCEKYMHPNSQAHPQQHPLTPCRLRSRLAGSCQRGREHMQRWVWACQSLAHRLREGSQQQGRSHDRGKRESLGQHTIPHRHTEIWTPLIEKQRCTTQSCLVSVNTKPNTGMYRALLVLAACKGSQERTPLHPCPGLLTTATIRRAGTGALSARAARALCALTANTTTGSVVPDRAVQHV